MLKVSRAIFQLTILVFCVLFFMSCVEWAHDKASSPPINPDSNGDEQADSININIANLNVASGVNYSPAQVAKIFYHYNFDIICFNDLPQGGWIDRVSQLLDMEYKVVSDVSSANDKNRYKAILSKSPLFNFNEFLLNASGWHPASMISAEIEKNSNKFIIYSLQIAGSKGEKGSYSNTIATNIIQRIKESRAIVAGDFDNTPEEESLHLFNNSGMNNMWDDLKVELQNENTCCLLENSKKGIVDHILYTCVSRSHTYKGGIIELKPALSNHKIIWAILEFPPPRVKKHRTK